MSRCNGVHRTAEGDLVLVALTTNPKGATAQAFIARATALAASLGSKSYDERVEAMIDMLVAIPKRCPKCSHKAE